jgi:hypothetical protein
MKIWFISIVAICGILLGSSALYAQDRYGLFSPSEKRAYHACLYGSFIENYCLYHTWEGTFRECVLANGAGRIPVRYPSWGWRITEECRLFVQGHAF